jgi:hypothetical protein
MVVLGTTIHVFACSLEGAGQPTFLRDDKRDDAVLRERGVIP